MKSNKKQIVLGVTGSIAAYKACDIVSRLTEAEMDVHVLLTKEASEFVTPLTFQTLSRNKVVTDMFEIPGEWCPVHISFADMADLVLIAPASANIIGKLASGICDDILSCVVLATKAPVLLAPAMNEKMYRHKIVQANIGKLKSIGYDFIGPVKGRLACGHEDIGHIAGTQEIISEVKNILSSRPKAD
jgi:phosphopantothenoylcysteine decarboxylase/phosphopantothenate--cysteine ligase